MLLFIALPKLLKLLSMHEKGFGYTFPGKYEEIEYVFWMCWYSNRKSETMVHQYGLFSFRFEDQTSWILRSGWREHTAIFSRMLSWVQKDHLTSLPVSVGLFRLQQSTTSSDQSSFCESSSVFVAELIICFLVLISPYPLGWHGFPISRLPALSELPIPACSAWVTGSAQEHSPSALLICLSINLMSYGFAHLPCRQCFELYYFPSLAKQ